MKLTELFNERSLTKSEEDKKEDIVKGMKKNKSDFKDRYGKDAEAVMYATATKMAKGESVEEAIPYEFTRADFFANEDENMHTENAVELAKKFGTPEEIDRMEKIMTAHNTRGHIEPAEQEERDELVRKYYPKLESIAEGTEMGKIGDVYIKQFAGGKEKGLSVQLTSDKGQGYVQLTKDEAKQVAERLLKWSTSDDIAYPGDYDESVQESVELTEEQFDEAAGEKDACYHKVKSRYKVWPSAYASGALAKCRKVGAKNWGNSKKK